MDTTNITQLIRQELPRLFKTDKQIQKLVLEISRQEFANRAKTESNFDRMLKRSDQQNERNFAKLQRLREKSDQKWAENQKELKLLREQSDQKWAESQKELKLLREEGNQKWAENQKELKLLREQSDQRWAENQKEHKALNNKIESSYGALGARWGIQSEASFRNALKAILEDSFDVQVLNVNEYDEEGFVFGHPDQVEMDIIIKNGLLIICEIKSSMTKGALYTFLRKITFYEKRYQRQATRHMVISPSINKYVYPLAKKFNVELYTYVDKIEDL